ncbi:DUF2182 domain-containing protein [Modestobacter altitudinis]|uniref:copper chaperone n=1 Tax=Modestobacter altitudinis TaxID=2213158 RepID=UPI001486EC7C|nr:DUF2182 domain-containing protein [Modestobacter altitudinis]
MATTACPAPVPATAGTAALMAAAMMLPSVLPTARAVALTSRWHRRHHAQLAFVGSYLAVWTAVGVAAHVLVVLLGAGGSVAEPAALVGAAAWELSHRKLRSLRACHRLSVTGNDGWRADLACARAGLGHARACAGACWALMATPLVVPAGTLLVMVVATAVVWGEVLSAGPRLATPVAATLFAAAVVLAIA